jgi:hypothetical protein
MRPDVINITVANEISDTVIDYPHENDDTHGRGEMIQDALALYHGRFDTDQPAAAMPRVCVAYALMQCNVRPPSSDADLTMAA